MAASSDWLSARLRRGPVGWLGGVFIAAIVSLAVYDTVRGYRAAVASTHSTLQSQARVIAEQTARSLQAVDVVLRHLAGQLRGDGLRQWTPRELHEHLRQQAVGLVQIDGMAVRNADGSTVALSWAWPTPPSNANVSDLAFFHELKKHPADELFIGGTLRGRSDGRWVFPIARRLQAADGSFAGFVGARGRVDYFQQFYRDVRLDPGSTVALAHQDGSLMARHPPADGTLGRHLPVLDQLLAGQAARDGSLRNVSPIDGIERFSAVAPVSGYPVAVVVSRDVDAALAAWRAQARGSLLRTAALALLAALLLTLALRQLQRLQTAGETLAESQERFSVAVAGSDDGIWLWDYASGRAFASARAREINGMPPGPELQSIEAWFAEIEARLHPDDVPMRRAAIDAHLAGRTTAYEIEYRVRDGEGYRWLRVRGLCARDAAGRPLRMAGSVSDIDARKRAEQALRESEERFALAVAGTADGIVDWDIVNDRMFTSKRAMEIAGIASDTLVRTRAEWVALLPLHPDDRQRHADDMRRHLEQPSEVRDAEYRLRQPDGSYRWVRVRGMSVRDADGRAVRYAGSVSDIDAQKRTEEALRRSEERYQLAVDGANEGLWDWDLANDRLFLSARAQSILGFAVGEPSRPRAEWQSLIDYHPEDRRRVRQATSEHLRGRTPHYVVEYRMRRADEPDRPRADWQWYRQRGLALRDAQGRPFRMAGSLENITARKRAEAERERLERQLRQSQKLEAIGTLAGGIAHDFNNILSAILGYGEMAQKDAAPGTPLRHHVDAAMSAGLRAKSLVERILAFSRSGMGERLPVHVGAVAAEALDVVAASLPPGVLLERRLDAGDAGIDGDPTQIHQVVMNLCANAVQAMRGEGHLMVSVAAVQLALPRTVSTATLAAGHYLRLAVADTGCGIEPRVLERIFDPFFTTKEVGVGTGLGLSLVHGIVTDLGGGIEVESRPGFGSSFTVWLPSRGDVPAPAAADERSAEMGHGQTVLLVDDEDTLVRLGEEMLAELGYEPVGFSSSRAALDALRADPERFQAVLSDEAMPGLTGSELAREIRHIRSDLPIVLMSGYVTPALQARAREAGVVEVLSKPLVARDIARSLALALKPRAEAA